MSIKSAMGTRIQTFLLATLLAWPAVGWPSAEVSDRPLFIQSAVDHNLMFVVDDSGSMDYETLASAVGSRSLVKDHYLYNPGKSGTYSQGKRIYDRTIHDIDPDDYYLWSDEYNLQFYDPDSTYLPWASTDNRTFTNINITNAPLDPGLSNSLSYDLTKAGELGLDDDDYPATFFVQNTDASVSKISTEKVYGSCSSGWEVWQDTQCRTCERPWGCTKKKHYRYEDRPYDDVVVVDEVQQCANISDNWYDHWKSNSSGYLFEDANGNSVAQGQMGLAPDGECLQRVELVAGNETEVLAVTGQTLAEQQQNFANWFSYYRRRHQAIRAAVSQSVTDLENMRLGVFWLNNRRGMDGRMYDSDTHLNRFLDDQYSRFDSGSWTGNGTPNRLALQHAGNQFAKEAVRGTLECRSNFALLFTDGFSSSHSKSSIVANNADKTAPAPFSNSTHQDTLGDIAYYYYQGLRGSNGAMLDGGAMRVDPKCGTGQETAQMDCNSEYHMNTYTVSLGMQGERYAGISHFKVADAHANPPNWGTANMDGELNPAQIDDLYHAAVNGKGEYYNAESTVDLVSSIQSAVEKIKKQLGSGSNVSFNTGSLKEGGMIYSAQFTSQIWTGTLRGETLGADGVVAAGVWDAADELNTRDLSVSPRLILTYGEDASGNRVGTTFSWDNLTAGQQADLSYGGDAELGKSRLAYLAGADLDGYGNVAFRERDSLLGAIINSSPTYIGIPAKNWPNIDPFGADGDRYSAFRSSAKTRQKMVYVGANDGMFHGFDADTGEEVLAYVPSFVYSDQASAGLHTLTETDYEYQSYVDLPVNASDVYIGGDWETVVISGARGGAPGIFALEVTDPSTFSATTADDILMWEFTNSDDARLGNRTGAVQIGVLKWGDSDYRWSAVFSNGYGVSKNGVFVLDIGKPAADAWSEGSNYHFIELADGTGLSPVRLVDNIDEYDNAAGDGIIDRAYAGDLEGRLWAINLLNGSGSWGSVYSDGGGNTPLFTATDSSGDAQPITVRPVVARNRYKEDLDYPNLIVLFGTGQYLTAADVNDEQQQSFYGISDRTTGSLGRDNLGERELTEQDYPAGGLGAVVRKTTETALDWATKYGWFVDFDTQTGERVVADAEVKGSYVVFPTNIPVGGDPCGGGGSSFLMALEMDGSTDPDKSIIDVNNDGKLDDVDKGWAGFGYSDAIINNIALIGDVAIGSASNAKKPAFLTDLGDDADGVGRVGWREIEPE